MLITSRLALPQTGASAIAVCDCKDITKFLYIQQCVKNHVLLTSRDVLEENACLSRKKIIHKPT